MSWCYCLGCVGLEVRPGFLAKLPVIKQSPREMAYLYAEGRGEKVCVIDGRSTSTIAWDRSLIGTCTCSHVNGRCVRSFSGWLLKDKRFWIIWGHESDIWVLYMISRFTAFVTFKIRRIEKSFTITHGLNRLDLFEAILTLLLQLNKTCPLNYSNDHLSSW